MEKKIKMNSGGVCLTSHACLPACASQERCQEKFNDQESLMVLLALFWLDGLITFPCSQKGKCVNENMIHFL